MATAQAVASPAREGTEAGQGACREDGGIEGARKTPSPAAVSEVRSEPDRRMEDARKHPPGSAAEAGSAAPLAPAADPSELQPKHNRKSFEHRQVDARQRSPSKEPRDQTPPPGCRSKGDRRSRSRERSAGDRSPSKQHANGKKDAAEQRSNKRKSKFRSRSRERGSSRERSRERGASPAGQHHRRSGRVSKSPRIDRRRQLSQSPERHRERRRSKSRSKSCCVER